LLIDYQEAPLSIEGAFSLGFDGKIKSETFTVNLAAAIASTNRTGLSSSRQDKDSISFSENL